MSTFILVRPSRVPWRSAQLGWFQGGPSVDDKWNKTLTIESLNIIFGKVLVLVINWITWLKRTLNYLLWFLDKRFIYVKCHAETSLFFMGGDIGGSILDWNKCYNKMFNMSKQIKVINRNVSEWHLAKYVSENQPEDRTGTVGFEKFFGSDGFEVTEFVTG